MTENSEIFAFACEYVPIPWEEVTKTILRNKTNKDVINRWTMYSEIMPPIICGSPKTTREIMKEANIEYSVRNSVMMISYLDAIADFTHNLMGNYRPHSNHEAEYRLKRTNEVWQPRATFKKEFKKVEEPKEPEQPKTTQADKDVLAKKLASWGYTPEEFVITILLHERELKEWAPVQPEIRAMMEKGFTKEEATKLYNSIKYKH